MHSEGFYRSVVRDAMFGYIYGCFTYSPDSVMPDFEFLDVNNAFLRLFGLRYGDVIGKRFSQVFGAMQREQAYLTFILQRMQKAESRQLRFYSRSLKRSFLVRASSPQAEHYVLEIIDFSPVEHAKKTQKTLKRQLHHKELLFEVVLMAMQNDNDTKFLDNCLAMIGEGLAFSHIYVFQYNAKSHTMDNTHRWVVPGVAPAEQKLKDIKTSAIPWWHQTLADGNSVVYKNIEDLPDETAKTIIRSLGIKSLLAMPIFIDADYYGFVGFAECLEYRDWEDADINLLSALADVFSKYEKHRLIEESLQAERAQLLSLFDSIQDPIYVADMENYEIIYANKAIQKVYNRRLCGEICYKAFFNSENPCLFCTNSTLKAIAYEPYQWEIDNPIISRSFRLVDRMIRWPDGRDVRLQLATDITDYKLAARDLQTEKERLKVTLHSIGDGVISTDKKGTVLMMNGVAESLTGWWQEEALGKPLSKVFRILDEKDRQSQPDPIEQALKAAHGQGLPLFHAILLDRSGGECVVEYNSSPIKNIDGEVLGAVLVFRDRTQQKEREAEILYLSYHDHLTGLYNRAFFEKELSRLNTLRQMPLSVIIGDVNGLKIINDVFGHFEGDRLLQSVAKLLKGSCRSEDIIARWGGDEFVILLPQTPETTAGEICKRITSTCQTFYCDRIHISIALGSATRVDPSEDTSLLLRRAEDNMYRTKLSEGKSVRSSIIASVKQTLLERGIESVENMDRLAAFCKQVGLAMALSDSEINELLLLAMLRDIGKVAISDSILKKTEELSPEEIAKLQQHTEIGYRISQSVPELVPIADSILSHHELWDGRGYPQGLRGGAIPLLARIVSITSTYVSLVSGSPRKAAVPPEQALQILADGSGTRFDPDILAIFLNQMGDSSC